MRFRRNAQNNLSVHERRVLDAFYCGRLSAGRLSSALAEARSRPAQPLATAPVLAAAAPSLEPAPLQLVA